MKKVREVLSSADLSASSRSGLNVCHWRNWNLHLLQSSSKHVGIMLPQMASTSRRRAHTSLLK
jgi:hypothetical protein